MTNARLDPKQLRLLAAWAEYRLWLTSCECEECATTRQEVIDSLRQAADLLDERAELVAALTNMTEDLEARWDMRDPRTNPGIRDCVAHARKVLAKSAQRQPPDDDGDGTSSQPWPYLLTD